MSTRVDLQRFRDADPEAVLADLTVKYGPEIAAVALADMTEREPRKHSTARVPHTVGKPGRPWIAANGVKRGTLRA